ncbi:hypothetical protein EV1_043093 [Malus domestica]
MGKGVGVGCGVAVHRHQHLGSASHTNSLSISTVFCMIPSTQAKVTIRFAKDSELPIHLRVHWPSSRRKDGVDRVEEAVLLVGVLNVRLEKEVVHLGMDVLNSDLEPVEGVGLNDLDLLHKPLSKILKDNAIGGSEEGREYAR